jgi:metaxin
MKEEVYRSLLEHKIRNAWLFTLYVDDDNFKFVAKKLYIYPSSSNSLVRLTLAHELQLAAKDELLKDGKYIKEDEIYEDAERAFEALSSLLGDDKNFFGNDRPTLFDASVFAYTHLLLDNSFGWRNRRLSEGLRRGRNLVRHRQRLLDEYFS